jgi:hypothetical protein
MTALTGLGGANANNPSPVRQPTDTLSPGERAAIIKKTALSL